MNKKRKNSMPLEYRVGMITAYGIMLLSIVLPLISADEMKLSFLTFFSKSKLQEYGVDSFAYLDAQSKMMLYLIRYFVIFCILVAAVGIILYSMEVRSRVKEGILIGAVVIPMQIYGCLLVIFSVLKMQATLSGLTNVHVGIGVILGFLAYLYAFIRPLVYLCMYKDTVEKRMKEPSILSGEDSSESVSNAKGQLTGLTGIYVGQMIPLQDGESIVFGRSAGECNMIVEGTKVSRKHCEITFYKAQGKFILKDYSSNGTIKENGQRYGAEEELKPGAIFYLGNKENGFQVN